VVAAYGLAGFERDVGAWGGEHRTEIIWQWCRDGNFPGSLSFFVLMKAEFALVTRAVSPQI